MEKDEMQSNELETPTRIRLLIPYSQFVQYAPKTLYKLMGRECKAFLTDGSEKSGFLYTIDPESHAMILIHEEVTFLSLFSSKVRLQRLSVSFFRFIRTFYQRD